MVIVVPVGSSPQRENPAQAPGEIVPGVRVDRLELTQSHPGQHSHQMYLASKGSEDQWGPNGSEAEKHRFPRAGVLGRQTKWRGVLVVDPMDRTIQWAPVERPMQPVMICVLDEEKDRDLDGDGFEIGKWDGVLQTEELHHWVEKDDHGQFNNKVDGQDVFDAAPLFLRRRRCLFVLNFVSVEQTREGVGDDPRDAAGKIEDFVC